MARKSKDSADSSRSGAGKSDAAGTVKGQRQERLAQALRDNLKKRKAQQRGRRGGGPTEP